MSLFFFSLMQFVYLSSENVHDDKGFHPTTNENSNNSWFTLMSIQSIPNDILVTILQTMAQSQPRRVTEVRRVPVLFHSDSGVMYPVVDRGPQYLDLTHGQMPLRILDDTPTEFIPALQKDIVQWNKLTQDSDWHFIKYEKELDMVYIQNFGQNEHEVNMEFAHTQREYYNYEYFAVFHRF